MRITLPPLTVSLSIASKRARDYGQAVDLMMPHQSYMFMADELRHTVTLDLVQDRDKILDLSSLCVGWAGAKFALGEHEVSKLVFTSVGGCSRERTNEDYCFGRPTRTSSDFYIWGCRLFCTRHLTHNPDAWWHYGHLEGGVFYLHKEDLLASLYELALEKGVFACPHFSFDIVKTVITNLPNQIDPRQDDGWEYLDSWQMGKVRRVGVRPSQRISLGRLLE